MFHIEVVNYERENKKDFEGRILFRFLDCGFCPLAEKETSRKARKQIIQY